MPTEAPAWRRLAKSALGMAGIDDGASRGGCRPEEFFKSLHEIRAVLVFGLKRADAAFPFAKPSEALHHKACLFKVARIH